jgi:uncharacterized protein (TIGR00255 family)
VAAERVEMIRSMTGFARSDADGPGARLRWEIRSVNHRYLDLQLRLPDGLRPIEEECRAIVAAGPRRGKVDATLTVTLEASAMPQPEVDQGAARRLLEQVRAVSRDIERPADIDPLSVLRWPGVLREPEEAELELLFPAARESLTAAVAELQAARAREGEKILAMLDARCGEILEHVAAVRARLPEVLRDIRSKLTERVAALDLTANPERLEQELALLATKLDVSEELDRLDAHVAEVRDTFGKDEPIGRRLDFLIQELNREANTLASKSADTETTRLAVELKVAIEQMREQVQNVE